MYSTYIVVSFKLYQIDVIRGVKIAALTILFTIRLFIYLVTILFTLFKRSCFVE